MNKEDLIFDWKKKDTHPAWKAAAYLIAALGFLGFIAGFDVRFGSSEAPSVNSGSVLFFSDQDIGAYWRLKAEEEGPFPGRLEIDGLRQSLDLIGSDTLEGEGAWNDYSVAMRPLSENSENAGDRLASQGVRFFPKRNETKEAVYDVSSNGTEVVLKPVLIPFSEDALEWLPGKLPVFKTKTDEPVTSASWRFILALRPNGAVEQCISLSGGGEANLIAMIDWLKGLRFAESDKDMRWMGLRVEFLNERRDGTDSE